MSQCELTPWEEHRFWLKIIEDHAHFVHDYLAPEEKKYVKRAARFIDHFQSLSAKLDTLDPTASCSSTMMVTFANQVYPFAEGYYRFEGYLQHLRIQNQVNLNLTPTYLNGTTNENQEYLRLLYYFRKGCKPPLLPLAELLDLWIEDQAGHALLLYHGIDPTETEILVKTRRLLDQFQTYMITSEQYADFLRFTKPNFPAQIKFIQNVIQSVADFNQIVSQAVTEYKEEKLLSRLTLRFLEHHFPETCYFLRKLTCYLPEEITIPDCQLHSPYFPSP